MTNYEYFKEEIENIKGKIAIINGRPELCNYTQCEKCARKSGGYGGNSFCSCSRLIDWYNFKYIPPQPKLTKKQMEFCKLIRKGWVARQSSGSLVLFNKKPYYKRGKYCRASNDKKNVCYLVEDDLPDFPFVKNGYDPICIEEMLTWEVE